MPIAKIPVLIPAIAASARTGQLDETNAALDQPASDQTNSTECLRVSKVGFEPVSPLRFGRFAADVHQVRHGGLHSGGEFVISDRGFQLVDLAVSVEHLAVELPEQSKLAVLQVGGRFRSADVRDWRILSRKNRCLVTRRQEPAVEVVEPARRDQAAIEHDEARQFLTLAAKSVSDPRAHARPPLLPVPRVQEVVRVGVLGEVRCHRANDGHVVDVLCDVRE